MTKGSDHIQGVKIYLSKDRKRIVRVDPPELSEFIKQVGEWVIVPTIFHLPSFYVVGSEVSECE